MHNPAIDNLVEASLESKYSLRLTVPRSFTGWISCSEITDIRATQIDNVYHAIHKEAYFSREKIMLLLLGSDEICTPTLVSEFARIYSFPTHKYNNEVNQFRRYSKWLEYRNGLIIGFTEYDDNYYMVADKMFYHYYSLYGFCAACGILRCSPVWCVCGH